MIYKNESLATKSSEKDLYDKVIKLGGLPKRLDRLIDEIKHLQVKYMQVLFHECRIRVLELKKINHKPLQGPPFRMKVLRITFSVNLT